MGGGEETNQRSKGKNYATDCLLFYILSCPLLIEIDIQMLRSITTRAPRERTTEQTSICFTYKVAPLVIKI